MIIKRNDGLFNFLILNLPGFGSVLTENLQEWFKSHQVEATTYFIRGDRVIRLSEEDYIMLMMKYL